MNDTARLIDAGHWIALLNESDEYHDRAIALSQSLTGRFVTTDAVLIEVGNAMARIRWRQQVADLIEDLVSTPTIEVISVTRGLFERSLQFFRSRQDKEWGLTDCISFVVMTDRGITEALAADQHFVQAGFRALLRDD
ncbi:MAG: type II toxin-antitoxin system VapC family toxin [Dehalococcoidia bacterium]